MRTLEEHLTNYAAYHRDRRNIMTHFVGIPMIVLAVFGFAGRPAVVMAGIGLSPALLILALAVLFYLLLDLRFGMAMLALNLPAYVFGTWLAAHGTGVWLGCSVGLFLVGWIAQFIGHAFEGRKPAFVDDLVGLLVGPLFLLAEACFAVGLRSEVREAIEAKVGPTRAGRAPEPV